MRRRLEVGMHRYGMAATIPILIAVSVGACLESAEVSAGDWTASCIATPADDCAGIAHLFKDNLAWSYTGMLRDSGGRMVIEPRPDCPTVPDWADGGFCWQATARTATRSVCMIIARQRDPARAGSEFGQVGGDDMTGRALGPPPDWQPCR